LQSTGNKKLFVTISKARNFFIFPNRKDVSKTQIENGDEKSQKIIKTFLSLDTMQ